MPPMSSAARTATPPPATEERERTLRILRAHEAELRALGVAHLSLFGSLARGEAGPDSDVDLLVEFNRPAGLLTFVGLQHYLEKLLGRKVDPGVADSLREKLRENVRRDIVHVQ